MLSSSITFFLTHWVTAHSFYSSGKDVMIFHCGKQTCWSMLQRNDAAVFKSFQKISLRLFLVFFFQPGRTILTPLNYIHALQSTTVKTLFRGLMLVPSCKTLDSNKMLSLNICPETFWKGRYGQHFIKVAVINIFTLTINYMTTWLWKGRFSPTVNHHQTLQFPSALQRF